MKKIDDLISSFSDITRKEEAIIVGKLNLIKQVYGECENSEDLIFFNEIINSFADIIEYQKEMVDDLKNEIDYMNYLEYCKQENTNKSVSEFTTDQEMQTAFYNYFTTSAPKKLSSYTVNDYLSRIRNLWNLYYNDAEAPNNDVRINRELIKENSPLINAYNHLDGLQAYVNFIGAKTEEKKNWANIASALNKFTEFINSKK